MTTCTSFNGYSAKLTAEQAAKLAGSRRRGRRHPGGDPRRPTRPPPRPSSASTHPAACGTSWAASAAPATGSSSAIIDTGIWPESLSFSDRTGENGNATKDGKLAYQQIPGWHGKCTPGEEFNASMCNQKLIGAQWFNAGYGGDAGIDDECPWEFNSVRDYGGHGTHTASTAGGNNNVPTTGPAAVFGRSAASRRTPGSPRTRRCGRSRPARAAAQHRPRRRHRPGRRRRRGRHQLLDQRHADQLPRPGRDLVPVRGRRRHLRRRSPPATAARPVDRRAPVPWTTTVAAGTHNRNGAGSVTLGNGATYTAPPSPRAVTAPLINSTAAGMAGADPTSSRSATLRGTAAPSSTRRRSPARSSSATAA